MKGGRAPGTVASWAAVPLSFQAAGASDRAAARVIFVILPILSIPLLPFPHLDRSRCQPGAMALGDEDVPRGGAGAPPLTTRPEQRSNFLASRGAGVDLTSDFRDQFPEPASEIIALAHRLRVELAKDGDGVEETLDRRVAGLLAVGVAVEPAAIAVVEAALVVEQGETFVNGC